MERDLNCCSWQLRNAAEDVSSAERSYFDVAQNNSSDEEVISFSLSVSYLEKHRMSMFIAKQDFPSVAVPS